MYTEAGLYNPKTRKKEKAVRLKGHQLEKQHAGSQYCKHYSVHDVVFYPPS